MNRINPRECSHQWIDPLTPPIQRQIIACCIQDGNPRAMQRGRRYLCRSCGKVLLIGPKGDRYV